MTPGFVNTLTLLVFLCALALGYTILRIRENRSQAPEHRIRNYLHTALERAPVEAETNNDDEAASSLFRNYRESGNLLTLWLSNRQQRLKAVCATQWQLFVISSLVCMLVLALALLWFAHGSWWLPLWLILDPLFVVFVGYRVMVGRFKKKFLAQFSDALDLIIRAVRAGVPANHAIAAAGQEFTEPLGSEFRLMGDGLRLGIDLKDVLDEANQRIAIPEFSFFSVCLLLQRETGGQLTETLENLSQIIRSRQEMAMKGRALTSETRIASNIIACIPFLVMGSLWFLNHDYIVTLFTTDSGISMLKVAMGMVFVGLAIIRYLSNLKV